MAVVFRTSRLAKRDNGGREVRRRRIRQPEADKNPPGIAVLRLKLCMADQKIIGNSKLGCLFYLVKHKIRR